MAVTGVGGVSVGVGVGSVAGACVVCGSVALCSKVHPSPGAARGVWALPQPPSCNMVADSDNLHNQDSSLINCSESTDLLSIQASELIFDAVKSGYGIYICKL